MVKKKKCTHNYGIGKTKIGRKYNPKCQRRIDKEIAKAKKGKWGTLSKKRVVRIKRTKKALKRKAYRSKN